MSLETRAVSEIIKSSFSIPLEVTYWDGSKEKFNEEADGPVTKIRFNEPLNVQDVIDDASLTLAEAYMDRKIEVDGSIQRLLTSAFQNSDSFMRGSKFQGLARKFKHQKHDKRSSKKDIQSHYDLGNDFYRYWLDDSMTYSCAYFKHEDDTLEDAQNQKIHHILNKVRLKEGDHLLDIGCGWGSMIFTAAEEYKVEATGVTLSQEQFDYISEQTRKRGLEGQVHVRLEDYRDLIKDKQRYNKIVSVGMLEHVGKKNISEFFEVINGLLPDSGGLALIHSICGQRDMNDPNKGGNSFLQKYIFPGGYIPAVGEIVDSATRLQLHVIDLESLRRHYQLTLEEWVRRYHAHWDEIAETKDDRFMRMWDVYLQSCAAVFEGGACDVAQYLIEKGTDNTRPLTRDYML